MNTAIKDLTWNPDSTRSVLLRAAIAGKDHGGVDGAS